MLSGVSLTTFVLVQIVIGLMISLFSGRAGGDLRDFPDAGALDLDDERLCARGCDLRRLCAYIATWLIEQTGSR